MFRRRSGNKGNLASFPGISPLLSLAVRKCTARQKHGAGNKARVLTVHFGVSGHDGCSFLVSSTRALQTAIKVAAPGAAVETSLSGLFDHLWVFHRDEGYLSFKVSEEETHL